MLFITLNLVPIEFIEVYGLQYTYDRLEQDCKDLFDRGMLCRPHWFPNNSIKSRFIHETL